MKRFVLTARSVSHALRVLVVFALVVAVVAAGVITIGFAAGVVGVPTLEHVDGEFGPVEESHTEVRAHLVIDNPNPVSAKSAKVSAAYTVALNDVEVATESGERLTLEPGRSTETLTTQVRHDDLPSWWASHVNAGERTDVVVEGQVSSDVFDRGRAIHAHQTVETDLLSSFESDETRPIDVGVPTAGTQPLSVNATRADWGEVDERRTELELGFDVYNSGATVSVTNVRYVLTVNDVVLGAGEIDREYRLESGTETPIDATATFETDRITAWWVSHLENDQRTDVHLAFEAEAEFPDGTTIDVPLDELTHEETIRTDLWGAHGMEADGEEAPSPGTS